MDRTAVIPAVHRLPEADPVAAARWDAFVLACPQATFFHRAGWQSVLHGVFRHPTHFLYAEVDGRIEGVLPLAQVKSLLFGNSLVSLPFAVYGGIAASSEAAARALEDAAQALAQRLKVEHLEFRNLDQRHADWPRQDLYATFRKTIAADDASNLQAIPRKQRAMVRKGIANGLQSTVDVDIDRFFALYASNVHRHGTPALPRGYFAALQQTFGADFEIQTVTSPTGEPVSSVLSFYFRDEVLPYYAGDAPAARELAANDFKYWELMRRAAARGVRVFDFGRSKQGTGSFSFKKNWGFEPRPLHYEYCLYKRDSVPQNNPSNPKYRLLIETWRRLPLALVNRIGPLVVRNLG
ncbi:FemAB family XrtA/PEP-CTERM system-associated protein [Piscinibacter koreensis]|uniref:FemAB family PEP-CTERM system-associated protein n=1 Tax=Piscinibacter koreensis TaxID=2742824 RepID=A0A7Y6NKZ5_9BURK|nr:FemAB family XrtA/PEP-CTERM system-associated protein [Schlegelella koreensis]NUZ05140.1 FemAB family PEP-CTERM system-associated protein [Schlegelella koreensis]